MRYTPIKSKGRRGLENDKIRAHVWPKILRRAYGVGGAVYCEGCKARGGVEWAHLFGRPGSGFCLGPLANSAELTAALCRECHNKVDRHLDEALALRLRQDGMRRLLISVNKPLPVGVWLDPDAIRPIIAKIEADGWHFDEERYELVHA
jgi:hypothetical protein